MDIWLKTKLISLSLDRMKPPSLPVDSEPVELIQNFIYMSILIFSDSVAAQRQICN